MGPRKKIGIGTSRFTTVNGLGSYATLWIAASVHRWGSLTEFEKSEFVSLPFILNAEAIPAIPGEFGGARVYEPGTDQTPAGFVFPRYTVTSFETQRNGAHPRWPSLRMPRLQVTW